MFFSNEPLICYLTNTSLELLTNNSNHTFSFPPQLVQHCEIVDEHTLGDALLEFLKQLNFKKNNGIIFLSPGLVFSGEFSTSNEGKNQFEQFLLSIPITTNNIAVISTKNKDTNTVYATNKKLYEVIEKIFKQLNIDIYCVLPVSVCLNLSQNQNITIQDLKSKLNNKKIFTKYNFLHTKQLNEPTSTINNDQLQDSKNANKKIGKNYFMLFLSLLLLTGAIIYFLFSYGLIPLFGGKDSVTVASSSETTQLLTPSPMVTVQSNPSTKVLDKSLVQIQILNGSGIEGQAGKVSRILESNGYKNISTANASTSGKLTSLVYSPDFSAENAKEIADSLKIDFPNIILQEGSQSAQFDVVITTRKPQ